MRCIFTQLASAVCIEIICKHSDKLETELDVAASSPFCVQFSGIAIPPMAV